MGQTTSCDEQSDCRLIEGRLETSGVHEDDHVLAFMDHQPVNPGHVLVAPRHHLPLFEDPDDVAGNAFRRTHHRHPAARARLADAGRQRSR
ncbi:HIT domain-containing protein [Kineococcus sp. R86509]|uniref:HIT domain-containing protein n=1 Tax=Kineococcus sp. R86509 TaxID=3093851 RepID=UPI0036D22CD6